MPPGGSGKIQSASKKKEVGSAPLEQKEVALEPSDFFFKIYLIKAKPLTHLKHVYFARNKINTCLAEMYGLILFC